MFAEIIRLLVELDPERQKDVLRYIQTLKHKEMRSHPRVDKKVDIDVLIEDKLIQTDSRDLSAAGVFVNTGTPARPGTPVKVVLTVSGHRPPFKLNGKIVRVEKKGIAIWFNDITPYASRALAGLIEEWI